MPTEAKRLSHWRFSGQYKCWLQQNLLTSTLVLIMSQSLWQSLGYIIVSFRWEQFSANRTVSISITLGIDALPRWRFSGQYKCWLQQNLLTSTLVLIMSQSLWQSLCYIIVSFLWQQFSANRTFSISITLGIDALSRWQIHGDAGDCAWANPLNVIIAHGVSKWYADWNGKVVTLTVFWSVQVLITANFFDSDTCCNYESVIVTVSLLNYRILQMATIFCKSDFFYFYNLRHWCAA